MTLTAPAPVRGKRLSELSTFSIGGPADYFLEVRSEDELRSAQDWAKRHDQTMLVIGKGSNCVFHDKGYRGLVVLNRIDFLDESRPGLFHVGAGYSFALLGVKTARKAWSGLEFASGIPGSVGGAVFMNAGANGQETGDILHSVRYLVPSGEIITLEREALSFRYRWSMFQEMDGVIVSACFALKHSEDARSRQLDIVHYRQKTQPYGQPSAGCVFRNTQSEGAGALIDRLGLKGLRVGDAEVSTLHGNFIVNSGQASSDQVKELAQLLKDRVYQQTGLLLEQEIRFIPHEEER